MSYHAKLSPSSAGRWLNCPACIRLSEGVADSAGVHAERGTLAHSIAEAKAEHALGRITKRQLTAKLKPLKADPLYQPEMDGYTDTYAHTIREQAMQFEAEPATMLETAVPIGWVTGESREDGSPATGTADCIQIGGDLLWLTDYKNGAGVLVHALENPQMMLYALGALALYRVIYGDTIKRVKMTVCQPAKGNVDTWECSVYGLMEWAEHAATRAAQTADPTEGPNPGSWCDDYFCPVRGRCPATLTMFEVLEQDSQQAANLLTNDQLGDIMQRAKHVVKWLKQVEEEAKAALMRGEPVEGYKLIEKQGNRAWADVEAAFSMLTGRGYDEAILYERKPLSPTALEKAVGKEVYSEYVAAHVLRPLSVAMVERSNAAPEYLPVSAAFEEVKNE